MPPTTGAARASPSTWSRIGCDVYIECSGNPKSVLQGLEILRKLGRFVEFSVFGESTTVDWSIIGNKKELDIYGSHLGPYAYPVAIDLIARGELRMDGVVTHFLPLERWHEALDLVIDGTRSIKVAIRP